MAQSGFNPGVLKFCALSGVLFCLMWLIGAGPIAGWFFIPPPSAANTALETTNGYLGTTLGIQIGVTICMFSSIFYTTWGVAVSIMLKKVEGDYPILFYLQLISLAACVVVIMYLAYFWAVAAFRPGDTPPEITQVLNDLGWFGVLYTGAPFALYQIALGVATLSDTSAQPIYPRWSAYLNFFISFFMIEAAGILFFKTGPFSQNGIFVFYVPVVVFFIWILVFSWLSYRAVDRLPR